MAAKKKSNNKSNKPKKPQDHTDSDKSPLTGTVLQQSNSDDYLNTFTNLIKATPRDQNGFLTYFLDHNMLPQDIHQRPPTLQQKLVNAAKIPLNNLEGYPAVDFSKPIWNQLPTEPESYYTAFRAYLLSPARDLQAAQEALPPGFTPFTLKEAYILFYWQERARAYDLLKPVAAARLKDQRLLLMEDQHYLLSTNLLKNLAHEVEQRADEQDGRPWQGLQAVDLFKSIIAAAELQRTALGLPSKGPKLNNVGYAPTNLAGIDRNIREAAANYVGADNSTLTPVQHMRQQIDKALAENPEQAQALQQAALDILLRARETQAQQQAHTQLADPSDPHGQAEK